MSTIRLSSANISFLVDFLVLSALTPLLKLLVVACTRRWGHLSVSLGRLAGLTIALCLCTVVGRSSED